MNYPNLFFFVSGIFLGTLLLITTISLKAQNPVVSIQFEGLSRSKPEHLQRFIFHEKGSDFHIDKLSDDVQQLRNLPAVYEAECQVDTLPQGIALTFHIKEAKTFFPIINFGGLRDNVWVQLGATELNLFGRGVQATAFYQNTDSRHNGQAYLRIPYIRGGKWGLSMGAVRWASVEPLFFGDSATVFYQYDNNALSFSGIRELSRNHWLEAGFSYFEESYTRDDRHTGEQVPGPEQASLPKLLLKLTHHLDRRNYHYYSLSGWDVVQYAQAVEELSNTSSPWFLIYWVDFRLFKEVWDKRKGNLGIRLRAGVSENRNSPFAPFVLDSHVNIRGSGNRIDRGTATFVWNTEYRHALYDKKSFAVQAVAFSDFGTWRKPGGKLREVVMGKHAEHFVGGGIRLIYKKMHGAILRADYGFNLHKAGQNGWVLGVGQYF